MLTRLLKMVFADSDLAITGPNTKVTSYQSELGLIRSLLKCVWKLSVLCSYIVFEVHKDSWLRWYILQQSGALHQARKCHSLSCTSLMKRAKVPLKHYKSSFINNISSRPRILQVW